MAFEYFHAEIKEIDFTIASNLRIRSHVQIARIRSILDSPLPLQLYWKCQRSKFSSHILIKYRQVDFGRAFRWLIHSLPMLRDRHHQKVTCHYRWNCVNSLICKFPMLYKIYVRIELNRMLDFFFFFAI